MFGTPNQKIFHKVQVFASHRDVWTGICLQSLLQAFHVKQRVFEMLLVCGDFFRASLILEHRSRTFLPASMNVMTPEATPMASAILEEVDGDQTGSFVERVNGNTAERLTFSRWKEG